MICVQGLQEKRNWQTSSCIYVKLLYVCLEISQRYINLFVLVGVICLEIDPFKCSLIVKLRYSFS